MNKINFGTDGWRGIIADDFTYPNVWKVTRAIASYLETAYPKSSPILVGYDTRFLADEFAYSAAEVLADLGWQVQITFRDCPTPVIAYNTKYLKTAGALQFTASHNPPEYCGIKYIPDYAGPATTEITNKIVADLESATDTPPTGNYSENISYFDPKPEYIKFLYSMLDIEKIRMAGLKVKYDALYSTSRGYLDEILNHCGCKVETFNAKRDVLFGGGMPEPQGKQLALLQDVVKKDSADLGMATDGDGDRFGIVDEQGNIVEGNAIFLVLARHLIKNKGKTGAIVRSVATTHLLDKLAAKYGLEIFETPVGFKHIGEKMRSTQVLIGGEESGGLSIIGYIPEKDGMLANMLVAEAIAYEGKPLSMLVAEVMAEVDGPTYNHRFDLKLEDKQKADLLTEIPPEIAGIQVKEVSQKDGIKLYLADGGWVLLRFSGTEPLLRVYCETDSLEKQDKIVEYLTKNIVS
ncbi:MAG: phosphoglucomutase/phosphomannomutase family protein [Gomphosphaeria aponina SAG 52.96 = DSM 107014]|uniref:Phosphoglucomutase/phosphomannomutase family protein n=1 Tax=Gomphosphaeria aponina SAG 52.96 = DSM 107014 TaxID=1521640 RepID=A0A941GV42_9CHRO|nr:phosphoglucomutase/phosphomannomutase family protein [Gomphosphaeria aponina SAG 52.96 = DSM 107014]